MNDTKGDTTNDTANVSMKEFPDAYRHWGRHVRAVALGLLTEVLADRDVGEPEVGYFTSFNGTRLETPSPPFNFGLNDMGTIADQMVEKWEAAFQRAQDEYWTAERLVEQAQREKDVRRRDNERQQRCKRARASMPLAALGYGEENPLMAATMNPLLVPSATRNAYDMRVRVLALDLIALLEEHLAESKAEEVSSEVLQSAISTADYDGVTGFQVSCALSLVRDHWRHGHLLPERP